MSIKHCQRPTLTSKGKIDEAVSLCNEILHRFPANKRAREKLNFLTNQICSKVNDPSDTAISEIVELFNKKEYSRIIERVEKLTVEFPRSFFLWNVLGVAKAKLGYYSSAISAYDVAISLDQKDSTVYTNKGNSFNVLDI